MGVLEELASLEEQAAKEEHQEKDNETTDEIVDKAVEEVESEEDSEDEEDEDTEDEGDEDDGEPDEDEGEAEEEDPKKRASSEYKERKRLRELRDKLEESQQKVARLEGHVEGRRETQQYLDNSTQQAPAQPADPEPDKELYHEEWMEWKLREQSNVISGLSEQIQASTYTATVAAARQEMGRYESDYSKDNDSYQDSKKFLRESEYNIARIQHPQATDAQINQHLDTLELQIASQAASNGRNPADDIFQFAKARGFTPGAKAVKQKTGPNLEKVKKNKRKSASLMSGSAAKKHENVSSEDLVDMTLAERLSLPENAWDNIDE